MLGCLAGAWPAPAGSEICGVPPTISAGPASFPPRRAADAVLSAKITDIHGESKGTYGAPRVHEVPAPPERELRGEAGRAADARRGPGRPPEEAVAHHYHRSPGCGTRPGPDPARFRAAPGH